MNKHAYLLKMFSGCQYTRDIAALYFPNIKSPSIRKKSFIEKIIETNGMYARMAAKGYKESDKFLTPQVLAIIVEFWGFPDIVETILEKANRSE